MLMRKTSAKGFYEELWEDGEREEKGSGTAV